MHLKYSHSMLQNLKNLYKIISFSLFKSMLIFFSNFAIENVKFNARIWLQYFVGIY